MSLRATCWQGLGLDTVLSSKKFLHSSILTSFSKNKLDWIWLGYCLVVRTFDSILSAQAEGEGVDVAAFEVHDGLRVRLWGEPINVSVTTFPTS